MIRFLPLLALVIACSEAPAASDSSPDAVIFPDATGCESDIADNFTAGECRCGSGPPCVRPLACRSGRCFSSDPEGDWCEFDDECPEGYSCINARCSPTSCEVEVCDGVDNDCDSNVDENPSSTGPISQWCPAGPAPLPPCRRGVQMCLAGEFTECMGENLPQEEVGWFACDGIDNDCDGCIDGVMVDGVCQRVTISLYDTVFLLDLSGSMNSHIHNMRNEVRAFSSLYGSRMEFRFALVTYPRSDRDYEVNADFVPFSSFESVLSGVRTNGGGSEPSYDVTQWVLDGTIPLAWRSGAIRVIVVITDEEGQSYHSPRNTETTMCDAASGAEVITFVTTGSARSSFDECGSWLSIHTAFHENLHSIIRNPCP